MSYAVLPLTLFVTLALGALGYVILYGGSVLSRIEDERLAAEKERLISEGRLRRAVNQAPVPMVIHDDDDIGCTYERGAGRGSLDTHWTTRAWPTVTAWAAKVQAVRYLGRRSRGTSSSLPWQPTRFMVASQRSSRNRATAVRGSSSTTPLEELDPEAPHQYLTMAIDLTERKKAEEDLRRLNQDLEQRIQERTREVTQANDALQRQSAQLSEQAALLELVSDGIFVRDLHERIMYWSTGAAAMYGWSRVEQARRRCQCVLSCCKRNSPQPRCATLISKTAP